MKRLTKETIKLAYEAAEALSKLYEALNDEHDRAQEYYDTKGERWQEGENGSRFVDFQSVIEMKRDEVETLKDELLNLEEELVLSNF